MRAQFTARDNDLYINYHLNIYELKIISHSIMTNNVFSKWRLAHVMVKWLGWKVIRLKSDQAEKKSHAKSPEPKSVCK